MGGGKIEHLILCCQSVKTFAAAKVQQIFVIHKDLTIKMKFISIFSGKALLLVRLCDRTFEVGRRVAVSVSSKILQIFVHKKNDIRKSYHKNHPISPSLSLLVLVPFFY